MVLRGYVAVVWLVVACLSANAQATVGPTYPSVIHAPLKYPPSAVSAREEGTVLVIAEVDASGRAVDAKVEESSGHPDLDEAALQSISGWSFSPAMKDGKPIAHRVRVPINFQLRPQTMDSSSLREAIPAMESILLEILGSQIWLTGFIWSIVLAKRKSIVWLSGMVALWIVTYPIFVAMHWSSAKRNLIVVSLGISLVFLGLYLAPSRALSI
ncbi:MAG: energy transducer TonB [Rhodanobacter sp.]